MKKLILTLLADIMALGSMAQGGIFTVKGTFDWKKDSVNFVITSAKQNSVVPPIKKKRAITGEMIEVSFNLKEASMLYVIFSENGHQTRLKKSLQSLVKLWNYSGMKITSHARGGRSSMWTMMRLSDALRHH